jgi:uncharacterized RDD family membrane protein YckC
MQPPAVPGGAGPGPQPRASFGIRFVAVLIDAVLLGVVGSILRAILGDAAAGLVNLVLGLGYVVYLEGSPAGQTVGKKIMNIRVVDYRTGGSIDYGRALVRYIGKLVSGIVCFLGYLWMLWDADKQTWHDKIATTTVVPTANFPVTSWP